MGPGYSLILEKLVRFAWVSFSIQQICCQRIWSLRDRSPRPSRMASLWLLPPKNGFRILQTSWLGWRLFPSTPGSSAVLTPPESRIWRNISCSSSKHPSSSGILGKAWLHYDMAFQKHAAASGLADWSSINRGLYNFHTRASSLQTSQSIMLQSSAASPTTISSPLCHSWNDGTCQWTFG